MTERNKEMKGGAHGINNYSRAMVKRQVRLERRWQMIKNIFKIVALIGTILLLLIANARI